MDISCRTVVSELLALLIRVHPDTHGIPLEVVSEMILGRKLVFFMSFLSGLVSQAAGQIIENSQG